MGNSDILTKKFAYTRYDVALQHIDFIKINVKGTGYEAVDRIQLARDMNKRRPLVKTAMNLRILRVYKVGNSSDQMRNC